MAIINSLGQLVGTGALNGSLSGTPAPQYQTQSNQILNVASMAQYKPTDYTRQADGSVILNAGVTPIAGTYKPAPTIPAQLPAANLMSAGNIQPAAPVDNYSDAFAKALGATQSTSLDNFKQQQAAQLAADQSTLSASEKAFNDLVAQISKKGTDKKTLENTLGVNDYTKQLADINTQIASKSVEFDTLINQNRDKSINSRIIGGTEDKIIRDRGVELGGLTARAQAMQGNIETAKQTAEDTIAFQYAPLEQELELKKMQLERAYDTFDASEKKRADDLLATIDAQKEQVTAEKAVRSKINDVMISASKNGADAETLKQIMASKDESGAILAAGNFLQEKTKRDIQVIGETTDEYGNTSKQYGYWDEKTGKIVSTSGQPVNTSSNTGGSLFEDGAIGGQCGDYTHKIADNIPTMGDLFTDKMKIANTSTNDWQVGDMLIQNVKTPYGHVSIVTGIDANGNAIVKESNWNNDGKVGTRVIPKGDKSVSGVYRGGQLKQETTSTPSVMDSNINAWAESYAANGTMPTGVPKSRYSQVVEASKLLPKPEGAILDKGTGILSKVMTPTQKDAYGAMLDLQNKTIELKDAFSKMGTGILSGALGYVFDNKDRTTYDSLRNQVVDLLSRARSGAALTTSEEIMYKNMLPGAFNKSLWLGGDGATKLNNFFDAISGTLDSKLGVFNADIIGRKKTIDGQTATRAYKNGQWGWEVNQ